MQIDINRSLAGKRVLVTGGSGFIGSHLVDRLLSLDAEVTVLTRQETTPWRLAHLGGASALDIRRWVPTDTEALFDCFASVRPDVVYHLASHPDGNETYDQVQQVITGNVSVTVNLLEACRRYPVKLFVYADSTKVYGNQAVPYQEDTSPAPICSYAVAKLSGWQFCEFYRQHHNVPSVSVRPTLIYGPRQGYNLINYVVESIVKGRHEIALMGGQQTRDPLYIDDAIEAFCGLPSVADQVRGRVINIGGGREYSILEITHRIARSMQVSIHVKADESQVRSTEIWRSYCLSEEARDLMGWRPEVELDHGLKQTIDSLLAAPVSLQVVSG